MCPVSDKGWNGSIREFECLFVVSMTPVSRVAATGIGRVGDESEDIGESEPAGGLRSEIPHGVSKTS